MPVAFATGIGVYFALSYEPSTEIICEFVALATLGAALNLWLKRSYLIYAVSFVVFGFALAFWRTHTLDTYVMQDFYKNIIFSGTILDAEDKKDDLRIILGHLNFDKVDTSDPAFSKMHKLRIKVSKELTADLVPGTHIAVKVTLVPFQGPIYPGGLDMRRQAYFEGVSAQGRIKEILHKNPPLQTFSVWSWDTWSEKLSTYRHALTQRLFDKLPKETASIGAALITGDRSHISNAVRQQFVDAGIAHILAISGLHLSIIAGFIFFLIRGSLALLPPIVERYPIKKIAALLVVFLTFGYLLISGAGYPVQRAFMMTTLAMIAIMLDRQAITMRLLALAAFIVLLIKPESLLSASFQLSFSAVVALIAFYESGWKFLYEWGRYGGSIRKSITYFAGIMITTIVATLATTPFTIFFFNRFTLQAVVGNILAIPLTGMLVMPTAFFATVSLSWGGSAIIFEIFDMSLRFLKAIATFTANLPGAAILIPSPPLWTLLIVVAGGLWLCLWQTRVRYVGLIGIIAGFACFSIDQTPDILISKNMIAYKKGDTLWISSNKGWFEKAMWQKHLGLHSESLWQNLIHSEDDVVMINEPREVSKKEIKALCDDTHFNYYLTTGYLPRYLSSKLLDRGANIIDRNDLKNHIYGFWLHDSWHHKRGLKNLSSKETRPWW